MDLQLSDGECAHSSTCVVGDIVDFSTITALDANMLDVMARSASTISTYMTLNFASTALGTESAKDQEA